MMSRFSQAWNAPGLRALRTLCGLALVVAGTASFAIAGPPPPPAAPEIDPGSIATGLSLLAGGVLLMIDRCRGK